MFDLSGRTAIVTGSSRGIGKSIAELFAAQGANVVITSRKLGACEAVADAINATGGRAVAIACNISEKRELEKLVEQTESIFGGIDIVVCNAATNPAYGRMQETTDEQYNKIFATNLRSNFWLCNQVAPRLSKKATASVILLSSIVGMTGSKDVGVYAMSKTAILQLVKNLAVEWGREGVRFNAIAPGMTKTDLMETVIDTPECQALIQKTPLGRIGNPEEVAAAALFLASDASTYITGQTLVVDGGVSITDYS